MVFRLVLLVLLGTSGCNDDTVASARDMTAPTVDLWPPANWPVGAGTPLWERMAALPGPAVDRYFTARQYLDAAHPTRGLFARTSDDGTGGSGSVVYRSRDRGNTWSPLSLGGYSTSRALIAGGALLFVRVGDEVLIGSDDDGMTWREIAVPKLGSTRWIGAVWTDGTVVLVTLGVDIFHQYIVRSEDAGLTWKESHHADVYGFTALWGESSRAISAMYTAVPYKVGSLSSTLFRSIDEGRAWAALGKPPLPARWVVGIGPDDLVLGGYEVLQAERTTDFGETWETWDFPEKLGGVWSSPDGVLYAGVGDSVWRSPDHGTSWTRETQVSPSPEPEKDGITHILGTSSTDVYAGTAGGLLLRRILP